MSTSDLWKITGTLFRVYVWKDSLGVSGFSEDKYREENRKASEVSRLNVHT